MDNGEKSKNWAGEIVEPYPEHDTYLIALDAPTLLALSDAYLMDCIEEGAEAYKYIFESSARHRQHSI